MGQCQGVIMRWSVTVREPVTGTFGQARKLQIAVLSIRKVFRTAGFSDYSSDRTNVFYVEHPSDHHMLMFQIQHGSALADCVIRER